MTREYVRAAQEQLLGYPQLKAMARASLRHSFADEATKARLGADLETNFSRFEREIAQRLR
jgi:adenosine deaminase